MIWLAVAIARGLSPRVRGKRDRPAESERAAGSIPACAGKPPGTICRAVAPGSIPACAGEARLKVWHYPQGKVYPRVCGGSFSSSTKLAQMDGLSPRVRGKLGLPDDLPVDPGSIPACAGEAMWQPPSLSTITVYPRVCGGSDICPAQILQSRGLSPRVRGKLPPWAFLPIWPRSIPACAGEARAERRGKHYQQVYPRVCGGSGE